jgi:hypothetical protein
MKLSFLTFPVVEALFLEISSRIKIQLFIQSDGKLKIKTNNGALTLYTSTVSLFNVNTYTVFKFSIIR